MIKKIKMMMMMIPVYLKGHADIGGDGVAVGNDYRKIKGETIFAVKYYRNEKEYNSSSRPYV